MFCGQVQGVGFRPYVYRLATRLSVRGTVANSTQGVVVLAQGRNAFRLVDLVLSRPPRAACITSFSVQELRSRPYAKFTITPSIHSGKIGVDVTPDIATCYQCAREVATLSDRRHDYAFTNCTGCGPRYSITESIPYDRERTTMRRFSMCPECWREYNDPGSRRFHAQPNACPVCGPSLAVLDRNGRTLVGEPMAEAAKAILRGRIVAIKSIGGFQLCCDAANDRAVARLRRLKQRPHKPLALMCYSISAAKALCSVTNCASRLLRSPSAPVVLMPKLAEPKLPVSKMIAPSNRCLGLMLPYTPIHLLLFDRLRKLSGRYPVIVATSANPKDNPIHFTEDGLYSDRPTTFDICLTHNRPIANPCDDSVVSCSGTTAVMVRRSRGYAPQPIVLPPKFHVKHPVLAVGGDMKNCFCLAAGGRAFLSPHIGSFSSSESVGFFLRTLERYESWTQIRPRAVVCDLHPDYLSTRLAERLAAERGLPVLRVQHHAAHVAAVAAEHGASLPVLGIACDGTGFGTDQAIWGCEFILLQPDMSWARLAHLGYMFLPQMPDEVPSPLRIARWYLQQARHKRGHYAGVRCSSLGRLFDAVAAITGVCRRATFDGHAAIALEAAVDTNEPGDYFGTSGAGIIDLVSSPATIRPEPVLLSVSRETSMGVPAEVVAARFHRTIVRAISATAKALCRRQGLDTVCLSGGSFQNSVLREKLSALLARSGHRVLVPAQAPMNDGGLSLGQAVMSRNGLLSP